MTFSLYVDAPRWRAHLRSYAELMPGIVPVGKGNGYGFGLHRLAHEASDLGVETLAVGLPEEVAVVRATFDGDVLVLTPYHPATGWTWAGLEHDERVIRTVGHLEGLRALAGTGARVAVELRTSMRRHGLVPDEYAEAARLLTGVEPAGLALHLPMSGGSFLTEARALVAAAEAAGLPAGTVWVSHLSDEDVRSLAADGRQVRPRVGTALWLGDRGALRARGTVLDVHPLERGDRLGYRQRRAGAGHVVVVSGGTTHGVGLEAPRAATGAVGRAKLVAMGGLEAAGRFLSPFTIAGRQRWYAEPPHMQVSMVLLPAGVRPPGIGDEVDCDVRLTTTTFDRTVLDPLVPHR